MAPNAKERELEPGTMVGEYRIERRLGEGGFGAVYAAEHPLIGKRAAVKVLSLAHSTKADHVSRFIAEARAVNQIRHDHIVDIFSFGELDDGRQYFVMELLEGESLADMLERDGALSPKEAMEILEGVAGALSAAHAVGIAHRDLKPENVMVTKRHGGGRSAKLIDFGIAKLLGDQEAEHKTRTGSPIGTPYFMSPEQSRGRPVDHRTDIYSFGVMCHVAMTGQLLFEGESVMDVLMKHMSEPPPRMSAVRPGISSRLDEAVLRLLAKDPNDRPDDALDAFAIVREAVELSDEPGNVTRPLGSVRGGDDDEPPPSAFDPMAQTVAGDTLDPPTSQRGVSVVVTQSGDDDRESHAPASDVEPPPPSTATDEPVVRSAPPPAKSWTAPVAAIAAVAAAAGFFLTRGDTPPPAPSSAPATTAAPASSTVRIQVISQSGPVDVYRGDDKIGSSEAPLTLPRSTNPITLSFRAEGRVTREREVNVREDGSIHVALSKADAPAASASAATTGSPAPATKPKTTPRSAPPPPAVGPAPGRGGSRDEIAF